MKVSMVVEMNLEDGVEDIKELTDQAEEQLNRGYYISNDNETFVWFSVKSWHKVEDLTEAPL